MNVSYSKRFVRMIEQLPEDIRGLFFRQESIFRINWRNPRLHAKRLRTKGKPILFSFRITRAYRVLFYFSAADTATLFAIGNRKDIYRNL